MPNTTLANVTKSLEAALTWDAYEAAKRRAGRLSRADQLAVVDAFIAARRRLEAVNAPVEISRPVLRAV